MLTITVEDLGNPLLEIRRALRRTNRSVVTAGIGKRKRAGHLRQESVLKVVLRRKVESPKNPIPRRIQVKGLLLGRSIRVTIGTDIEELPVASPSFHSIGPLTNGVVTLGCYARWPEAGRTRLGCLTAGHGMWTDPKNRRPRSFVNLQMTPGTWRDSLRVRVRAASHLLRDGVDVALLEFPARADRGFDPRLIDLYRSEVTPASMGELVRRLGKRDDDRAMPITFPRFRPREARSTAYYPVYSVLVNGWGNVRMEHVIESEARPGTFLGGTSGSGIVTTETKRLGVGLQSLCLDPGANSRSLATSLEHALAWIRGKGLVVEPIWKIHR